MVSWIHVDLLEIETWPSKQSWTNYVNDNRPGFVWRAADGDGAVKEYASLDRNVSTSRSVSRYGFLQQFNMTSIAVSSTASLLRWLQKCGEVSSA